MKKLLLIILLGSICFKASAQYGSNVDIDRFDSGAAISLSADYDKPIANLGYTFAPSVSFGAHLMTFHDNFTFNYSLGYVAFKPKLDTFYYKADDVNIGTATYQNFTAVQAYLGFAYNLRLTDQFWLYGGLNMGAYFTHYYSHSEDVHFDSTDDFHDTDLYLAPKAGITYALSNSLLVSIEGKYNAFAPTGKKEYSPNVGTLYNSVATGIFLTYKF